MKSHLIIFTCLTFILILISLSEARRNKEVANNKFFDDFCIYSIGGDVFNFTGLIEYPHWNVIDPSNTWTFNYRLCGPIRAPCPSTTTHSSKCGATFSAMVCQRWDDQNHGPQSACVAQWSEIPSVSPYSNGADYGISIKYVGGDECDICRPMARQAILNVICDPSYTEEPGKVSAIPARVPDPTYTITMRHYVGCPVRTSPPPATPPTAPGSYCTGASTCQQCLMYGGCGWCDGVDGKCIPGNAFAPSFGRCSKWSWYNCN